MQANDATDEITLSVSDAAPTLKLEKFIKGKPVEKFEPGRIYVVEFWATWWGPCKTTMPHFTELEKKLKDRATFVGVKVSEDQAYTAETLKKVEAFVKKHDEKMGYTVAFDGGKKETGNAYMKAAGQYGIPCAFVITDGRREGGVHRPPGGAGIRADYPAACGWHVRHEGGGGRREGAQGETRGHGAGPEEGGEDPGRSDAAHRTRQAR